MRFNSAKKKKIITPGVFKGFMIFFLIPFIHHLEMMMMIMKNDGQDHLNGSLFLVEHRESFFHFLFFVIVAVAVVNDDIQYITMDAH